MERKAKLARGLAVGAAANQDGIGDPTTARRPVSAGADHTARARVAKMPHERTQAALGRARRHSAQSREVRGGETAVEVRAEHQPVVRCKQVGGKEE